LRDFAASLVLKIRSCFLFGLFSSHHDLYLYMRKKESFDSFIIGFFQNFRQSPYLNVCKPFFPKEKNGNLMFHVNRKVA